MRKINPWSRLGSTCKHTYNDFVQDICRAEGSQTNSLYMYMQPPDPGKKTLKRTRCSCCGIQTNAYSAFYHHVFEVRSYCRNLAQSPNITRLGNLVKIDVRSV